MSIESCADKFENLCTDLLEARVRVKKLKGLRETAKSDFKRLLCNNSPYTTEDGLRVYTIEKNEVVCKSTNFFEE